ncbi:hypothetical protein N0V86_009082 [Didymella sp. IMI 355093]|nr:hypothetical protein N0V86_009082 [Didymella sp. IMI 355093]
MARSRADPSIRLAPLACINHNWQAAVERELWNHISIDTSADTSSEDFHLLRQYTDGPLRQSRRSMIQILGLGWNYGHHAQKTDPYFVFDSDGNGKVAKEATESAEDDLWDFPELVSCDDDDGLDIDAGNQPEPDWDKINALIWDDESEDDSGENHSGHRSESDPDRLDDDDDNEEDSASTFDEEEAGHMDGKADADVRKERTWESTNALLSSDESNIEEPLGSEKTRNDLLEQLQYKQISLFALITDLWTFLAGWNDSLNIKRINLQLRGSAFNSTIYAGLRHDEERIVKFLQSTMEHNLSLPTLPHVEEVFFDGRRALAFWPALVAAKIVTASHPSVPIMEYRAQPFEKWWKAGAVASLETQGMWTCLNIS